MQFGFIPIRLSQKVICIDWLPTPIQYSGDADSFPYLTCLLAFFEIKWEAMDWVAPVA